MASVTIPGAGSSTIIETFGNTANLQLAIQIRDALVSASAGGVLNVTTVAGGGNVPVPPSTLRRGRGQRTRHQRRRQLHHTGRISGCTRLRRGYRPDYCWGRDDPRRVELNHPGRERECHDRRSGAECPVRGSRQRCGHHQRYRRRAGRKQSERHSDGGRLAGSISGGTGTNLFRDLGANDTISAQGNSDTIFGGPNSATIQLLGASIFDSGNYPDYPARRDECACGWW